MGIDGTSNPVQDNDTPAATRDGADRSAEHTGGQQLGTNDDRSQRRVETLTREQYADAMRADGPPIRRDSPNAFQYPGESGSDSWRGTAEAERTVDRDTPRPQDREKDYDHAVMLHDETDRAEPTKAEPLTREQYADAMRGNGMGDGHDEQSADAGQDHDASATPTAVTHFHGEFKEKQLDLYTDGTRWAAADTPRRQEPSARRAEHLTGRRQAKNSWIAPGEGSSLLERLRRGVDEESADEADVLEKDANVFHDVFSHPPTSS